MRAVTIGPLWALHWPAIGRRAPRTLLAIHGVWVGALVWNQVGPYLASHGYETYAVWLRHHEPGADPGQLEGLGLQDYADDVAAVARNLSAPVLLGHSMGGLLAQLVATATEPSGLALLASAPPFGIPVIPPTVPHGDRPPTLPWAALKLQAHATVCRRRLLGAREFRPARRRDCPSRT